MRGVQRELKRLTGTRPHTYARCIAVSRRGAAHGMWAGLIQRGAEASDGTPAAVRLPLFSHARRCAAFQPCSAPTRSTTR